VGGATHLIGKPPEAWEKQGTHNRLPYKLIVRKTPLPPQTQEGSLGAIEISVRGEQTANACHQTLQLQEICHFQNRQQASKEGESPRTKMGEVPGTGFRGKRNVGIDIKGEKKGAGCNPGVGVGCLRPLPGWETEGITRQLRKFP